MSLHHLFAFDNVALAGLPEADNPTLLHEFIGDTLASFGSLEQGWHPGCYYFGNTCPIKRLALLDLDAYPTAIEADGFSFRSIPHSSFGLDRENFRAKFSAPDAGPPDAKTLIEAELAAFQKDPVAHTIERARNLHPLPDTSDVVSTLFTMRDEVVLELGGSSNQFSWRQEKPDPAQAKQRRIALGKAIVESATSRYPAPSSMDGFRFYPVFRKCLIVRKTKPTVCFWVFNSLHVVDSFDERHWAVLEKVGIVKR